MIYSVGMQLRWSPIKLGSLFLDSQDYWGLEYWYNNVKTYTKQLKDAAKGKTGNK